MLAVSTAKVGGVQLDCWRRVESERKCDREEGQIGNCNVDKGLARKPLPDLRVCDVAASWASWHRLPLRREISRSRSPWSCETMGPVAAPLAIRQHFECIRANSTVRFIQNIAGLRVVHHLDSMCAQLSLRAKLPPASALRHKHCCSLIRKRERDGGGEERRGAKGRAGKRGGVGQLGHLLVAGIAEKAEGDATWRRLREEQGARRMMKESVRGRRGRVVRARSGQDGLRLSLSSHVACNGGGKKRGGGLLGSRGGGAVWKSFSPSKSDSNRTIDYCLLTWQMRRCDASARWVAEASSFGWSWWRRNRKRDGGKKEEDKKQGGKDKEVAIRRKVKVTRVERSTDGGVIFTFGSKDEPTRQVQGLDPLIAFVLEDRKMEKGGGSNNPHPDHHHQLQSGGVEEIPADGADDASGTDSASDSSLGSASDEHNYPRTNVHRQGSEVSSDVTVSFGHDYNASGLDSASDSSSASDSAPAPTSDQQNDPRRNLHRYPLESSSDVTVSFTHDYDASGDASGPDSASDSPSGPALGAASDESNVKGHLENANKQYRPS